MDLFRYPNGHDYAVNRASARGATKVSKTTCVDSVQGRIAWAGTNKIWTSANLALLCKGAETSLAPGKCFQRVMSGAVDYGGGTKWLPTNALKLCGGATDADERIACFERKIGLRVAWQSAVEQCLPPAVPTTCAVSGLSSAALCGGLCVDLRSDSHNCGRCANECNTTLVCQEGICGCPAGQHQENGICIAP